MTRTGVVSRPQATRFAQTAGVQLAGCRHGQGVMRRRGNRHGRPRATHRVLGKGLHALGTNLGGRIVIVPFVLSTAGHHTQSAVVGPSKGEDFARVRDSSATIGCCCCVVDCSCSIIPTLVIVALLSLLLLLSKGT